MADSKAMVRSLYDGISNASDIGAMLDDHLTEDFVEHEAMPGMEGLSGKKLAEQQMLTFQATISDLHFNLEDLIQEGNKVVARATVTGTHTGEFMGIPASGNPLEFKVIDIFELRDDRISAHWGVTDSGTMLMQMGAMQPPG